jgi:hypothetical protein
MSLDRLLILLGWAVLVVWATRPVPGRGIPVGRRLARIYLNRRQAVGLGTALLALAVIVAGVGLWLGAPDPILVGLCLGWLGAVLVHHGRRSA